MKRVRNRTRKPGYSLLEMVLAMTIFSVGVGALMSLTSVCVQSASTSRAYTDAVYLAQGLIEEKLADSSYTVDTETGDSGGEAPEFSWTVTTEETETSGLYKIEATVTWKERGAEKSYALTTLAAER